MTTQSDTNSAADVGPFVYLGAYTVPPSGRAEGVYVYRLDGTSGALTLVQTVPGVVNPTYLALSPDGSYLSAVNEVDEGEVSAFARDRATGHLTVLNRQASRGSDPCHLSVHQGHLLVAHYGSGSIAALPIGPDGRLGPATSVAQHAGSGVHPRQEEPHAHMVVPDPVGQLVMAVDLGLDQILAYRLEAASGRLIPNEPAAAYESPNPGAGPRQVAFNQDGRHAFVLNELDSTLTACGYDPARGVLRPAHTLSTLPEGFEGENTCAHVVVAPGGRFVYASNRGHDSIAIFEIDDETGRLTGLGHEPTRGRNPRAFGIDPTGTWLLAANQDSDTVVSFRIDTTTGALSASGRPAQVPTPVCVIFAGA